MIEIDIIIEPIWGSANDWHALSKRSINKALEYSNYKGLLKTYKHISISISLSNNQQVHALNNQYRSKDKPTNILSFPMLERDELDTIDIIQTPEIMLGDLILAYNICNDEALAQNITLANHFAHLIIHGILHLLQYNHIEDADADIMQSIEINALRDMGIDNPYKKG